MGCHFLLQGIFLTRGRTLSPSLAGRFLTTEPPGKPSANLFPLTTPAKVIHLCPFYHQGPVFYKTALSRTKNIRFPPYPKTALRVMNP